MTNTLMTLCELENLFVATVSGYTSGDPGQLYLLGFTVDRWEEAF